MACVKAEREREIHMSNNTIERTKYTYQRMYLLSLRKNDIIGPIIFETIHLHGIIEKDNFVLGYDRISVSPSRTT